MPCSDSFFPGLHLSEPAWSELTALLSVCRAWECGVGGCVEGLCLWAWLWLCRGEELGELAGCGG